MHDSNGDSMKQIPLASTALVGFAGPAAAINFTG
jgi:hypothetical protein